MKHGREISPWCRKPTNSDSRGTHPIGGGAGKCMGSGTEGKQSAVPSLRDSSQLRGPDAPCCSLMLPDAPQCSLMFADAP